jgi:dsRNA-specific ribonuclease
MCTSANTGDVLQALIGAAHLDGGFAATADVAVRLCGWSNGWALREGLHERRPEHQITFVGSEVLLALAADYLVRAQPHHNHEWYSTERSRILRTRRLARVAASTGLARGIAHGSANFVPRAHRNLRVQLGHLFLREGWDVTQAWVVGHLLLPHLEECPGD